MGTAAVVGDGAPEIRLARGLARRGGLAAPAVIALAAAFRGADGAASAAFSLALVVGNFLAAARIAAWAARISPGALMAAVLGGYVLRLAVITAVVLLVHDHAWVDVVVLAATLAVAHLGLLIWEAPATRRMAEEGVTSRP